MDHETGHGSGDRHEPRKRGGHFSVDLTKQAQTVFRARTGHEITEDEARGMLDSLTEFFHLLIEWDRRNPDRGDKE